MKLWEIKANALRLMFADSDVMFSREDFEDNSLYENANTREKLVRMEDSIRRAIALYYQHCGQHNRMAKVFIRVEDLDIGKLDLTTIQDMGYPTRIDIIKDIDNNILGEENVDFFFDGISKEVYVKSKKIENANKDVKLILFYDSERLNLPEFVDELEFDLDDIFIPKEVQLFIPEYIKSEIYEEDESAIAMLSRNKYLEFLMTFRGNFSKVQKKVKSNFIRG